MSEIGNWFDKLTDGYSPFKACTVDAYVCHEIEIYYGSYVNAVEDGEYESMPLTRSEVVAYAYNLYMGALPNGVRYQGKAHFEALAEKVVKGLEDSWGCTWAKEVA